VRAHPVNLVTISRELGAGGSDFARALGAELGWPVLDREIVHRVADQLHVDDMTIEHADEHPPSLLAKIAAVLTIPSPDLDAFPPPDPTPMSDAVARAATRVIEEAGALRPLIVVGHGAQCIFAGQPGTLHVRLVASMQTRIQRVATRVRVAPARAANLVQRTDHERQAYVHRYFHYDWRSALLYDIQVNTTEIGVDESVSLVAQLVRSRSPKPNSPAVSLSASPGNPRAA
jgi:hypothetical protein